MSLRTRTELFDGTRNLGETMIDGTELEVHQCGTCGVIFGVEKTYMRARREDHQGWSCPNEHGFVFNGESEKEKLRREAEEARREAAKERARLTATRDLLRHEERSHASTKGHLTRTKKRVHAGVCPVDGCHRHFKDLERHIANKHPRYKAESKAK